MNCVNHPDLPAIAYCRACGKPLCEACRVSAGGTVYCQEHAPVAASPGAAAAESSPYTAPAPAPDDGSPRAGGAALCGLIVGARWS